MRRCTLIAFGAITALASAAGASAGFVGMDIRVDAGATANAQALGGALADATVWRLYAVFDTSGDKLLNMFNMDVHTTNGSTLYQDGFGGDLPPQSAFFGLVPSLPYDSFVTINLLSDNTSVATDPDFAFTSNGVVGGWFNSNPPNNLGLTSQNGSVWETLVAQFTTVGGSGGGQWYGQGALTWNDASGTTHQVSFVPPAPGVGSLLAMGALGAGLRRRR